MYTSVYAVGSGYVFHKFHKCTLCKRTLSSPTYDVEFKLFGFITEHFRQYLIVMLFTRAYANYAHLSLT